MQSPFPETNSAPIIISCDGDPTIREGDWLRLWNSLGVVVAHDVWVGTADMVYENSGPGGFVRRNTLANVLAARKVIHIIARTSVAELAEKVAGFYNCQDFASEVATGMTQSFRRDAVVALATFWRKKRFHGKRSSGEGDAGQTAQKGPPG